MPPLVENMNTIQIIALYVVIFTSGMLVGYLLKIFISARSAKKASDQDWKETKRLIAESEANEPTAEQFCDEAGAHLVLKQKGQPMFDALFYSQLQMLGWIGKIEKMLEEDIQNQCDDEEDD